MINPGKYLKAFTSAVLLLCIQETHSQNFFATVFAGSSNYTGDLQERPFTLTQSHPAFGVGLLYELNPHMFIRGDFAFGKISAADKYSAKNYLRNLSFYSTLYEYSLCFEYTLLDVYKYKATPFIYTGIALFDFNPYTKSKDGNDILLAELNTEGQGFYDGRKPYKLRQFSIPVAGGLQWNINANKRLNLLVGYRKTFTDYIDDVSMTYVDENLLRTNRGQKVVELAYRGDELTNGVQTYPAAGTPRGNPKSKDMYYFVGMSFHVRIKPKGKRWEGYYYPGKRRKARIDCPKFY